MLAGLLLDRDGIVNVDHGYVHRIDQVTFIPGIFDLVREAARRGMPIAIVTNQAGIGRGLYTEADFATLTAWMRKRFAEAGAPIAAVYHAPEAPAQATPRRKPGPGMLLEAARDLGLDLGESVMLGDRASDMLAALAAGVGHCLLVPAQVAERAAAPQGTLILDSVADAAAWLCARPEPGGVRIAAP
ncbi:D-glycero-alpha-D-manno-heptose-1,7-bisphosphate 7-phosphatase [Humitalea sp. 24SJ18S-53]|uniref:D-glycero-alpha-D-manno-heptose-1,7-bisphosphate 7-phosphatase n=1 Tax=Humitalea sp. 24SJ18S-53 TaxID=3422307 RepID=UPI003D66A4EA